MIMRYARFCSNFLFPFQEKLKGHATVNYLEFLEKSQWWTEEKLNDYIFKKKENFLQEILQYVPYYIRNPKFDFVNKSLFRENFIDFKSKKNISCKLQRTGGSTGEPLYFLISKERIAHDVAAKWRATRWFDVDIGDKEWVFWGSPIEISSQSIVRKIRDFLLRSTLIPARNLSSDILDGIIQSMRKSKPKILFGYPSILGLIAGYAEKKGIRLDNLGIKVIFVTSEVLDFSQRILMQTVFGAKVANGYGGRESGFIAHECPQGNMHITMEDIIVEIIKADQTACQPGEIGEIVVTHLHTGAFPLIRYKTGDYGAVRPSACLCGRQLAILSNLEGRRSDLIFAQDGSMVHRAEIVSIITRERDIEQFQVIQQSLSCVEIKLKSYALKQESKNRIINGLKQLLGQDVTVLIEMVSEFNVDLSGKFRFVTSNITQGLF